MKNLLIATDTFLPKKDGVTKFLEQVVPSLTESYNVTILAPSFTQSFKEETFQKARVIRFPVRKRVQISSYPAVKFYYGKVKQYVKEADRVWIQSAAPLGFMALLAARKYNKALFAYIHSLEWEQLTHILTTSKWVKSILLRTLVKLEKYVYNKCDILMVPAKSVAIELAELGIETKQIIIPMGIDAKRFFPIEDKQKAKAKQKVHLSPDSFVIGYCGRISKEKDLKTLAQAFIRLQEHYPNLHLLIVGDGNHRLITHTVHD